MRISVFSLLICFTAAIDLHTSYFEFPKDLAFECQDLIKKVGTLSLGLGTSYCTSIAPKTPFPHDDIACVAVGVGFVIGVSVTILYYRSIQTPVFSYSRDSIEFGQKIEVIIEFKKQMNSSGMNEKCMNEIVELIQKDLPSRSRPCQEFGYNEGYYIAHPNTGGFELRIYN